VGGLRVYPKGMELGPSSNDPSKLSLWVTDYGLDQKADGRVIEIMLDRPVPPPPVQPEILTGTNGNDTLQANSNENWVVDGLAGNDSITTLGGNDVITGGAGNDTISAGNGDDVIRVSGTGEGFDSVNGGGGVDRIQAAAKGTKIGLTGVTGVELITSNGLANVTILGSTAADTLDFTNVTLTGIASINGGAGNDTIYGSAGADMIIGLTGADTLSGNGGADIFDYNVVAHSRGTTTRDKILDFEEGTDKIDLSTLDASTASSGNQAFSFIGQGSFTNKAGQLRIDTSDSTKTLVLADLNGDGVADFAIELAGSHSLSAGDFFL
jgi:Ca2+-binding RTX toxin-like protein